MGIHNFLAHILSDGLIRIDKRQCKPEFVRDRKSRVPGGSRPSAKKCDAK
jgi:hypothetical protein